MGSLGENSDRVATFPSRPSDHLSELNHRFADSEGVVCWIITKCQIGRTHQADWAEVILKFDGIHPDGDCLRNPS